MSDNALGVYDFTLPAKDEYPNALSDPTTLINLLQPVGKRYIIGLSGVPGMGKSSLLQLIYQWLVSEGYWVQLIEVDVVGNLHSALKSSKAPIVLVGNTFPKKTIKTVKKAFKNQDVVLLVLSLIPENLGSEKEFKKWLFQSTGTTDPENKEDMSPLERVLQRTPESTDGSTLYDLGDDNTKEVMGRMVSGCWAGVCPDEDEDKNKKKNKKNKKPQEKEKEKELPWPRLPAGLTSLDDIVEWIKNEITKKWSFDDVPKRPEGVPNMPFNAPYLGAFLQNPGTLPSGLVDGVPEDWTIHWHHLTFAYGAEILKKLEAIMEIWNQQVQITVTGVFQTDEVIVAAVNIGTEEDPECYNHMVYSGIPHITIATAPKVSPGRSREAIPNDFVPQNGITLQATVNCFMNRLA